MNSRIKAACIGLVTVLCVLSYAHDGNSDQMLEIAGSTTCQKRFLEPAAESLRKRTGIKIKVDGIGTGRGLIALIDGNVMVSAASEDLEGAIKSAKKVAADASRDLQIPSNLEFHEIISDLIIPIVHKENTVSDLTWQQLRDLNTGTIANWNEVGGPNLPVQIITSHAGSATKAVFQQIVMDGKDYAFDAIVVDSTRKEILAVSKNRAGMGAVSMTFMQMFAGDTKPVRTSKISRPLGLLTIGSPQPDVQKMIDFMRSEEAKRHFQ